MRRLTATLLAVIVVCVAGSVNAEEPHKAWWKYLKGEWTFEIEALDTKGTVTWRLAAKGNAMVGRLVTSDGRVSSELSGWRADKKQSVVTGYGSEGNYWVIEFTKMTADATEGLNYGVLPDGRTYKGTFKGKKVDQNHYEWHFTGKAGDGEDLDMKGEYVRKTEE